MANNKDVNATDNKVANAEVATNIVATKKYKFKSNQFRSVIADQIKDKLIDQRNDPRCTNGQGAINIKAQVLGDLQKLDFVKSITIGTAGNNARLWIANNKVSVYMRTNKNGVSLDISAKTDQTKIWDVLTPACTVASKVKKGASTAPSINLVDIKTAANLIGATPKFIKVHHRNDQPTKTKGWHIEVAGINTLDNAVTVLSNVNALVSAI